MEDEQPIMPYDAWKADPTPDNLAKVVDSLQPVMNYQLGSLGVSDDPLIKNKARIVAAQAVRKYDPKLATLPTFVSRQLQQLRRFRRQSHQVLKVPERIQMDGWHLAQKEKEFLDKHDREPDLYELADFSKLPVGRIAKIRRLSRATPSEAAIGDTAADDMDFTGEALEYVFRDSDHLDRRILEMKTGYGGHQVMTPAQIAQKLRISTAQVSRRAARLTMKVNQLQQDMQDINR